MYTGTVSRSLLAKLLLCIAALVVMFVLYLMHISYGRCECHVVRPLRRRDLDATVKGHRPAMFLYNRVPKCGSSTFMDICEVLGKVNGFSVIKSRIYLNYTISKSEQEDFKASLSEVERPALFERHIHFIPLDGMKYAPVYINLIRDPIDRLSSWYYYIRTRTIHTKLLSRRMLNMTYDECVLQEEPECTQPGGDDVEGGYFKLIPFFCGQHSYCSIQNQRSYDQAVANVNRYYGTIGYLKEFRKYLALLEAEYPSYFKGSELIYNFLMKALTSRYKTPTNKKVSARARRKMRSKLKFEYRFHAFVVQRFAARYANFFNDTIT